MKIKGLLSSLLISLLSLNFLDRAEAVPQGKVETAILFNCNVSFHATGRSAYIVLGFTKLEGRGVMSCYDFVHNVVEEIPLRVTVRGPGVGLGITGINISGARAGIGLNGSPDALLGKYLVVRGSAAVGVGAAAGVGLRISKGAFDISVQIEGASGLGAGVDLLTFELDRDPQNPARRVAMPAPPISSSVQTVEVSATNPTPVLRVSPGQVVEVVDERGQVISRYVFVQTR